MSGSGNFNCDNCCKQFEDGKEGEAKHEEISKCCFCGVLQFVTSCVCHDCLEKFPPFGECFDCQEREDERNDVTSPASATAIKNFSYSRLRSL